ncbi:Gfo/Idh/MocA family oxidoreductase [Candidatus Bipolaricaulota bacterium]|nr:Gfo/Idh/MocA family oxidoreductase [Candidatus Bipolaricaulota bacterium]
MKEIGVAVIGTRFMGRAHANAYRQVRAFFDPPLLPRLAVACGRDEGNLQEFSRRFGFDHVTVDWEEAVARDDVGLVDISCSNDLHAEIAEAAARLGKAVFCEKPLARDLPEAERMLGAVEEAGVPHMVCFNYRFFPAIRLARELIREGALGEIRQFHALYLQDWGLDPNLPRSWRMVKELAGSGALGDTAVHIVDLARFLVGEISEVCGMLTTFIKKRPLPDGSGMGEVTVDDTAAFLARFSSGATGVFETTRVATGRKNFMHLEVNGARGSIHWNAEDPNVLWFYSLEDPPKVRGFRRIVVTERQHPWAGSWWPPGHILGYEHSFVHAVYELLTALGEGRAPEPGFQDGVAAQAVLQAVARAHAERCWLPVELTAAGPSPDRPATP